MVVGLIKEIVKAATSNPEANRLKVCELLEKNGYEKKDHCSRPLTYSGADIAHGPVIVCGYDFFSNSDGYVFIVSKAKTFTTYPLPGGETVSASDICSSEKCSDRDVLEPYLAIEDIKGIDTEQLLRELQEGTISLGPSSQPSGPPPLF